MSRLAFGSTGGAEQPDVATDSRDDHETPGDGCLPYAMTFASLDKGARAKQLVRVFAELVAASIHGAPGDPSEKP